MIVEAQKTCSKCKQSLPLSMFYKSKDTHHGWCKPCMRPYNALKARCHKYGLTKDEVQRELQKDHCFLCKKPLQRNSHKQFDHCYISGKYRDILCVSCNNRMGGVDDREWLGNAIAYRDYHAERHACL